MRDEGSQSAADVTALKAPGSGLEGFSQSDVFKYMQDLLCEEEEKLKAEEQVSLNALLALTAKPIDVFCGHLCYQAFLRNLSPTQVLGAQSADANFTEGQLARCFAFL